MGNARLELNLDGEKIVIRTIERRPRSASRVIQLRDGRILGMNGGNQLFISSLSGYARFNSFEALGWREIAILEGMVQLGLRTQEWLDNVRTRSAQHEEHRRAARDAEDLKAAAKCLGMELTQEQTDFIARTINDARVPR